MNRLTPTILTAAALALPACSALTAAPDGPLARSLVLDWGARGVDSTEPSGDSDDVGGVVGLEYSKRVDGGLGWEAGLTYSQQEEFLGLWNDDEPIDVLEANLGARATYLGFSDQGAGLQPYASAGLALLGMHGRDADKGALGAYLSGGLRYVFGPGFTMGLETKWLASTSDYVESYGQFCLQFGWSF